MLFSLLLTISSALLLILAYQNRLLRKERKRLLRENSEDSNVLFLNSRYASMGETVGNIAHQWKQPLNAIGAIQNSIKASLIFQGDISKEKLLASVETSFKLLQHLAETIDTFYSFLSQRNNEMTYFLLSKELESVRKITEYSFQNSKINLNFILDSDPTIRGNANEFIHAILNLILNAKDAFDDSDIDTPIINLHIKSNKDRCIITVCDNAGGIRLKPIEMVFDLHITTKESGSGLGLFMTKKIIENRFGGTISVINRHGGACFTIELPYAEYGEYFNATVTTEERVSLDRINQLSQKVIELEEVEKNLKKWADIFKQAHWAIAIHVGTSTSFELTNAAFQNLYGYTSLELSALKVPDLFTIESLSMLPIIQKEAFEKGYVAFETINKRRDGSTFPVSVELIVVKDDEGEILYHMANIWDMSEKKAVEKELLLLNKALNNTNEAVYITIHDTIIQVNDGACRMLGYSRKEFASMSIFDIDKDATPEDIEAMILSIESSGSVCFERKHYTKDGRALDVEIIGNFFEHEGITYSFSAVRDITEQKQAREELLLKKFAINTINEAVYLIDKDSMFHYVNEAACTVLGYSKEELLTMGVTNLDPNFPIEQWKIHWEDIKEKKTTLTLTQHQRKDGTLFPIEISSNYFEYNGVGYSLAVSRDITDRQLLEEQKDNERMRLFFERQLVGMAITSPENRWIHTNEKLQEMLGYTHEELIALTWTEMTYPEDLNPDVEKFERLLHGEIEDYMIEKRFIRKDGTIVHTNLAVSCVRNDDRSVNYVLALLEDITERKEAEQKLSDSHAFLTKLIDSLPDPIFVKDRDHTWLILNQANCDLVGLPREELLGKTDYDFFPKEEADVFRQNDEIVFNTGKSNLNEEYFTSSDGTTHYIQTLKAMFIANDGREYLVGTIRDMSKRKETENAILELNATLEEKVQNRTALLQEAVTTLNTEILEREKIEHILRENEETFHAMVDNSPDVIIRYDLECRRTYINPRGLFLMGKPLEEVIGRTPSEYSPLPESVEFEKLFLKVIAEKKEIEVESPYRTSDGEIRWGNQRIIPEFDEDRNVVSVMVIGRDMTERKNTERRLKLLETAVNNAEEAVFIVDDTSSIIYGNAAACTLLGYEREELVKMKIYEIDVHLFEKELSDIKNVINMEKTITFRTKHKRKDGSIIDVQVTLTFFEYDGISFGVSLVKKMGK